MNPGYPPPPTHTLCPKVLKGYHYSLFVLKTLCLKLHVNICMQLISKSDHSGKIKTWNFTCVNVSQHILIFSPKWPGFQGRIKALKPWGLQPTALSLSTRGRGNLPWRVSQCTHQVRPERQGQSPVIAQKQSHWHGWGLPNFKLHPQLQPRTWPQEGDGWPEAFRRAQIDPDYSVKSSLATRHRVIDL